MRRGGGLAEGSGVSASADSLSVRPRGPRPPPAAVAGAAAFRTPLSRLAPPGGAALRHEPVPAGGGSGARASVRAPPPELSASAKMACVLEAPLRMSVLSVSAAGPAPPPPLSAAAGGGASPRLGSA